MSRVQSIERAFAVLAALEDGPIGVTEAAERADLPKSTVARLLAALALEDAVEQVPGGTSYRLGPRIVSLAAAVAPTRTLVALARSELEELAAAVGEATGLSIADGFSVQYIDQVDTPNPVQVRDWTGTRVPMHTVPSGQVLLAGLGPTAVERYVAGPLEAFTPRTITDAADLRRRLRDVLRDGFAWGREEFALGINSVAAPVADGAGALVAAVHVHGPSYRFPAPGAEDEVTRRVVMAAARISARMRAGNAAEAGAPRPTPG